MISFQMVETNICKSIANIDKLSENYVYSCLLIMKNMACFIACITCKLKMLLEMCEWLHNLHIMQIILIITIFKLGH